MTNLVPLPISLEDELELVEESYPGFLEVFLQKMQEGKVRSDRVMDEDGCGDLYGHLALYDNPHAHSNIHAQAIETGLYSHFMLTAYYTPTESILARNRVRPGDTPKNNAGLRELDIRIRDFLYT